MLASRPDLITSWQRYTSLLEDMIETEPLLLPPIRRWIKSPAITGSHIFSQIFKKTSEKFFRLIKNSQGQKKSDLIPSEFQTWDILFLPGFARINCLGTSQLIAQSLWKLDPDYNVGIIPPIGEGEANLPSLDERFIKYNFIEKKFPSLHSLRSVWSLFVRVREKISSDPILSELWRKNWHLILFDIARFYQNMQQAKELLLKTECRLVVCLNEQLWPGSAFIPAAKELGIPTVQILHGTPTKLYWPFISDETWVWDKSTRAMFEEYGTPRSRMYITGNLEASFWLTKNAVYECDVQEKKNNLRTCLFLSQWAGSEIWDVPGFDEPVNWLAEALSNQKDRWQVVIRLHPYDGPDAQVEIQKKLSFLGGKLAFSDSQTTLVEDILDADFVCTGSSTAILMAQAYNKPALLLWTPVMEYVHGQPFLEERHVVYSSQDLSKIMQYGLSSATETSYKNAVHKSDYVAAQRVLQLLK